jgi:hypothetical protein
MGRQILSAGGAPKPASTTTGFRTRQSQKKNQPGQVGGLEIGTSGVSAGPKPRALGRPLSLQPPCVCGNPLPVARSERSAPAHGTLFEIIVERLKRLYDVRA